MDILAKRRLLADLRAKGRRRVILRKPGVIRYPVMLENKYAAVLKTIADKMTDFVRNEIIPKLDIIVAESRVNQPQIHKDAWADRIEQVFNYGKEMFYKMALPLAPVIEQTAERVASWTSYQIARATERALGAQLLVRDTFTPDIVKGFIKENVGLMEDLSSDTASKIRQAIYDGIRNGRSTQEIADRILRTTGEGLGIMEKAKSRAERIARDQVGKLNGQLTMARQTAMGITRYRWRTMLDNRVRDEHKVREGRIFHWNRPPSDGHPGVPINCRCYAEPVFDDILPELEEPDFL